MTSDDAKRIAENVAKVRERIASAAERCGRAPQSVTLVAVTKYVDVDEIRAVVDAGCLDIGESRPQELWRKAKSLGDPPIRWHLVGHLQRNKVRRTLPFVDLVHSADSARLIESINAESATIGRKTSVLLEVNVSGDVEKHGITPDGIEPLLPSLAELDHVEVRGLMAMASLSGGVEQARTDFRKLRELRDRLLPNSPPSVLLTELSMGMSRDFETAIEEGDTIVRVGSALFEGLAT